MSEKPREFYALPTELETDIGVFKRRWQSLYHKDMVTLVEASAFEQLRAELESERELAKNTIVSLSNEVESFRFERDQLRSQLAVARKALEFYGDKANWKSVTIEDTNRRFCIFTGADLEYFINEDRNSFCGKRAREALKNLTDEEK